MSYPGMMDGWHGDENECYGDCGMCDECDTNYYQSCDEINELWIDEQILESKNV